MIHNNRCMYINHIIHFLKQKLFDNTLILIERKHIMARGISKRQLVLIAVCLHMTKINFRLLRMLGVCLQLNITSLIPLAISGIYSLRNYKLTLHGLITHYISWVFVIQILFICTFATCSCSRSLQTQTKTVVPVVHTEYWTGLTHTRLDGPPL